MKTEAILDFKAQAEQMLRILMPKLEAGNLDIATELLVLKFKALFEQGEIHGRKIEQDMQKKKSDDFFF